MDMLNSGRVAVKNLHLHVTLSMQKSFDRTINLSTKVLFWFTDNMAQSNRHIENMCAVAGSGLLRKQRSRD